MAISPPIPPLEVVVRKRDKVVYEGQAYAISSVNSRGPFDILSEHANFISVIKDVLVIHKMDKTEQKITIKNGVLHSVDNKITVYLDTLTIDPATSEAKPHDDKNPTSPPTNPK